MLGLIFPLFHSTISVWAPPGMPSLDTVREMLKYSSIQEMTIPSFLLEQLADDPDMVEQMGRIGYIGYVGGNVRRKEK